MAALTRLLHVVVRLDVRKIIAEGNDVAVFFELETKAPVAATTLVAEWHRVKNGKIFHVESAFDGRPFRPCSPAGNGRGPSRRTPRKWPLLITGADSCKIIRGKGGNLIK